MAWPTTSDPRTEFVTVRFTASEAADIDWLTQHTGARSRSAAVRRAVDRVVSSEQKRAKRAQKQTAQQTQQPPADKAGETVEAGEED